MKKKTKNTFSKDNKIGIRVDHKNSERLFLLKKVLFDRLKEK